MAIKKPTILIIENNPNTRKMLGVTLQSENYQVIEAADEQSALLQIKQQKPDFILQKSEQIAQTLALATHAKNISRQATFLQLLFEATSIIAETNDFEKALHGCLTTICTHLQWPIGHIYLASPANSSLLIPSDIWYMKDPEKIKDFYRVTMLTTFEPGIGLPGRIFSSGEPVWIEDVHFDNNFPRVKICEASHVHGALGFPIKANNKVIAVFEFFTTKPKPKDQELLNSFKILANQLSQVFERQQIRKSLQAIEERKRARLIIDQSHEAYIAINNENRIIEWNKQAEITFGWTREEAIGNSLLETIIPTRYHEEHTHYLNNSTTTEKISLMNNRIEAIAQRKNQQEFPVELSITSIQHENEQLFSYFIYDITGRKQAEKKLQDTLDELEKLAYYDPLTTLANRTHFMQGIKFALGMARRHHWQFAILFLDIDQFKLVNDSLGHKVGDQLLQNVAKQFVSVTRAGDIVARLGGDEFVFLVNKIKDASSVATFAKKLLRKIKAPIVVEEHKIFTTASIGISLYPDNGAEEDTLLKNADIAMYKAKQSGRNNFQFCTSEMTQYVQQKMSLDNELHNALAEKKFILLYQPQIDLKTGLITSIEALIRLPRQDGTLMLPASFIPLAEEIDLIFPMSEWVLETACRQKKVWESNHPKDKATISVAINLSGRQLKDKYLLNTICKILEKTQLAPSSLELEITETAMIQDMQHSIQVLNEIKMLGVYIALDDFGVGYSSLNYLKQLPIDTLKIDQSFIQTLMIDQNDSAIVKSIIAMAHTMGIIIVAEGVETKEQAQFLAKHHCDRIQGYYFKKPLTVDEMTTLLQEKKPWNLIK